MIRVQKFGGTSVANAERIRKVAAKILECQREGHQMVVVVSAPAGTTDDLMRRALEVSPSPAARELDMLLASGEQISIALLAMAIEAQGGRAISFTAGQVGIRTDGAHTKAKITQVHSEKIQHHLDQGQIVIVAGFQGVNDQDEITTLGRGGSDTTAVALAAAMQGVCEIYTDVDGVYSADPRIVPDAQLIPEISYNEMLELASLGAKVLHLRSVELAKKFSVPLWVRSSFTWNPGTVVKEEMIVEQGRIVIGVAQDVSIAKLSIVGLPDTPGIAAKVFSCLGQEEVNVDMIVQSASRDGLADISLTVKRNDLPDARKALARIIEELGAKEVGIDQDRAKVSVVGAGMISHPGVAALVFETLAKAEMNIEMISTSDISISCIISESRVAEAVRLLHKAFGLGAE